MKDENNKDRNFPTALIATISFFEGMGFNCRSNLTLMLLTAVLFMCGGSRMLMAEDKAKENTAPETSTASTDFDWCVLVCPKTCTPGKEFEIRIEPKNLKETTRNWEANKLPVHLFWSGKDKWGGYLSHFGSVEVTKGGPIVIKGKFDLDEKIKNDAAYVCVNAYLTSDWGDDKNKAADLMGPKIEIVKEKASAVPAKPASN